MIRHQKRIGNLRMLAIPAPRIFSASLVHNAQALCLTTTQLGNHCYGNASMKTSQNPSMFGISSSLKACYRASGLQSSCQWMPRAIFLLRHDVHVVCQSQGGTHPIFPRHTPLVCLAQASRFCFSKLYLVRGPIPRRENPRMAEQTLKFQTAEVSYTALHE